MAHSLDEIREAMSEVERLEAELEAAKERRTQLATRLYGQNGPTRTYLLAGEGAGEGVELIISRTKPRRDGSVSYFFAEKQRWRGRTVDGVLVEAPRPTGTPEAVAGAVEMAPTSGAFTYASETPLTGRVLEATAVLTGRAEAGQERPETQEHPRVPAGMVCGDLSCSVCAEERQAAEAGEPLTPAAFFEKARDVGHDSFPTSDDELLAAAGRGEETPSLLDRIGASDSERELYSKAQLPPEETARLSGALDAAIEAAPAAIEAADELIRGRARLPIARLEAPEPKLLQIQEPASEPDIDPDQAILDELLNSM